MTERTKGTDSNFSKEVEEQNKEAARKAAEKAKKAADQKLNRKREGGLVGGQPKLDMNKDGMITGQDFKMMPKKYGGKITYRMSGGKVIGAGYDD